MCINSCLIAEKAVKLKGDSYINDSLSLLNNP